MLSLHLYKCNDNFLGVRLMEVFRLIPYQKMYARLLNAITDALNLLEDGDLPKAKAVLKQAQ